MELFRSKLDEGRPVSPHVLHMINLIEQLGRCDFHFSDALGRNLILQSLPPSFSQFIMNYNMQGIKCSYSELNKMLQTVEEDIKKGVPTRLPKAASLSASSSSRFKKTKKKKKQTKGKKSGPSVPPSGGVKKPKRAAEDACHHCGEIGHWKRNCPQYLAHIRQQKASSSGIFTYPVIDISMACEATVSSWILDSACPVHICNSLQGMRDSRNLRSGEMQL